MARLADEVKELAKHGVMIKPELQGLHPDQIKVGYGIGLDIKNCTIENN